MDLHWVAGGVVLLILVAISAYTEAIESDRAMRLPATRGERHDARAAQQEIERV